MVSLYTIAELRNAPAEATDLEYNLKYSIEQASEYKFETMYVQTNSDLSDVCFTFEFPPSWTFRPLLPWAVHAKSFYNMKL